MLKRGLSRKQGVILIITLWLLATLALLSLGFAHRVRLEVKLSDYQMEGLYALELARAGVTRAFVELKRDGNEVDHLGESWHTHPPFEEENWFEDKELRYKGRYKVRWSVMDETGKINVNLAPKEMLVRLPNVDDFVASATIDWRDADNIPGPGGAEDYYYRTLRPSYQCKDKPFEVISELLLVRGVTPEIYFGEDANENGILDPNEDDGSLSFPKDNADGELDRGLRDLLTVYGDGLINLNTAPKEVLFAIPGVSEQTVDSLVAYRAGLDGVEGTADDAFFTAYEDLQEVSGLTQFEYLQLVAHGTFSSSFFTIHCEAWLREDKVHRKIRAVVQRTADGVSVISWQED